MFDWRQIEGFGNHDAQLYYETVVAQAPPGATLIEVGCWFGRGLVHLAQTALAAGKGLKVVGVDKDDRCRPNLERAGLSNYVGFVHAPSLEAAGLSDDELAWWVFLDDDHTHEAVAAGIDAWMPKVVRGGVLAGHDAKWHSVCEPVRAKLRGIHYVPPNVWWVHKQIPRGNERIFEPTRMPWSPDWTEAEQVEMERGDGHQGEMT